MKMKVLILCTGNSCRSQMAHGFMQSMFPEMTVCSAGTRPAEHVNPTAVKVMAEVGIDISTHTPKSVEEYLNEPWDYVVTVCGGARESCPVFVGEVGEHRHIGFDDPSEAQGAEDYVMSEFHRVRDAIAVAFKHFGEEIWSNC